MDANKNHLYAGAESDSQSAPDLNWRFYRILGWLRKRRTLACRLALAAAITENIIGREKPHELLHFFDEPISMSAVSGLVLILAGAFFRIWARGHFVKGRLFTTGPYAIIRHPLYLGSLLIVLGVLFQLNDGMNWVIVLPVFALFHGAAAVYEERSMAKKFGIQWHLYKARTPAIIPSLSGCAPLGRLGKWSWKIYLGTPEVRATPWLLALPLLIELLEEVVFESVLHV
jgi:hypothetical protein